MMPQELFPPFFLCRLKIKTTFQPGFMATFSRQRIQRSFYYPQPSPVLLLGEFGKVSKQRDHISSRAGPGPPHLASSPATQTASQHVRNQVDWLLVVLAGCPDPDQPPRTSDVCAAVGLQHLGADNTSFSANIFGGAYVQ